MRPSWWLLSSVLFASACAGASPTYTASFTDRWIRIESYRRTFATAEESIVQSFAGDPRLIERVHPKMGSVVDPTAALWTRGSPLDPFAFGEREVSLGETRARLEELSPPPAIAAELASPGSKIPGEPVLRRIRFEQSALLRTIAAESDRLERERTLANGAADLLRALVAAWPASRDAAELHQMESLVALRLEDLEHSLASVVLTDAERDDGREALAELVPLVTSLPHAAAAVAKLQTAFDSMWVVPYATEDEARMDQELHRYVGSPVRFDALDAAFADATGVFDLPVDAGLSVLDEGVRGRIRSRARSLLFAAPACKPREPVHTVLDMAPPDERAWSCSLLHALDDARTDEDELAADLAWRDATVVARWAVSTHGPVRTQEAALRLACLDAGESPAELTRLMRLARARPLRAIAAGVAASLLTQSGGAHVRTRARKWRAIGDAPMDLVAPLLSPEKPVSTE